MSSMLQVESVVGKDGSLVIQVPRDTFPANARVLVTVQPISAGQDSEHLEWRRFLDETYGSCAGLGLERPEQGKFEEREPLQ